jgi:hypothetical protein
VFETNISARRFRLLLSAAGILGVIALLVYFSAPFILFPFPPANTTEAQLAANVSQYKLFYLLAAWIQGTGSLLSVIFILGLVYLARGWMKFSGWITMLAATVVLVLSLNEGTYFVDIVQASANSHPEAAITSFDLSFVFIHTFFIAPSLLLPLAFVLRGTTVLPKFFWAWALVAGIAFEAMGLIGLVYNTSTPIAIGILVIQEAWLLTAAITLATRRV